MSPNDPFAFFSSWRKLRGGMEPIEHLYIWYGRHESSDQSDHAQQFFSEKKIKIK